MQAHNAAEQLVIDMQEASSIRYGVGLRVALLSSGRWAIYYGTESETGAKFVGNIRIIESFNDADLRNFALAELMEREAYNERYERRSFELNQESNPATTVKSTKTLDEMEL